MKNENSVLSQLLTVVYGVEVKIFRLLCFSPYPYVACLSFVHVCIAPNLMFGA